MKPLYSGILSRRLAAAVVIAGGFGAGSAYAAAPITQTYSYTPAQVQAGTGGAPFYLNTLSGADGFSLVEPAGSPTDNFLIGTWVSSIPVENSFQARIDASVPFDYVLQSITFSFSMHVVNWNALDNETSAQSVQFQYQSLARLRYLNTDDATLHTLSSVLDSVDVTKSLAADSDGALGVDGTDFPFVPTFGGDDSYIEAPHGVGEAHPGTTAPNLVDPASRTLTGGPTTLTSGTDFDFYKGSVAGTIPTLYSHIGSGSITSGTSVEGRFRVFSYGSYTVSYTFVPEAETWAAGASVAAIAAGCLLRRRRGNQPSNSPV